MPIMVRPHRYLHHFDTLAAPSHSSSGPRSSPAFAPLRPDRNLRGAALPRHTDSNQNARWVESPDAPGCEPRNEAGSRPGRRWAVPISPCEPTTSHRRQPRRYTTFRRSPSDPGEGRDDWPSARRSKRRNKSRREIGLASFSSGLTLAPHHPAEPKASSGLSVLRSLRLLTCVKASQRRNAAPDDHAIAITVAWCGHFGRDVLGRSRPQSPLILFPTSRPIAETPRAPPAPDEEGG